MKKIIILIFAFIFVFAGCTIEEKPQVQNKGINRKSVWITYYELSEWTDNNETDFYNLINNKIVELKSFGFNTVTVQVRPCADAFYFSSYFPISEYQKNKKYDVLKIFCDVCKKSEMDVEAWINPYRISQNNKVNNSIAYDWLKSKDNSVVEINNKLYFNPAFEKVKNLIVNGVGEIVENYNISAIHFDDYFYPEDCGEFDKKQYQEYKQSGGELSLSDWRRDNVNKLINKVKKTINNKVQFGISPASNIEHNYNNLYADVEWWISNNYIDYVCPQIYFGFKNEYQPFMQTTKKWIELCESYNVDLYIGLPLYKSGMLDEYASSEEDIKKEFIDNDDIIKRQIKYISQLEKIKGYYIFSYSSLYDEKSKNEVSNMLEVMQDNNQA